MTECKWILFPSFSKRYRICLTVAKNIPLRMSSAWGSRTNTKFPYHNILEKTYSVTLAQPKYTNKSSDHKEAKQTCDLYVQHDQI